MVQDQIGITGDSVRCSFIYDDAPASDSPIQLSPHDRSGPAGGGSQIVAGSQIYL